MSYPATKHLILIQTYHSYPPSLYLFSKRFVEISYDNLPYYGVDINEKLFMDTIRYPKQHIVHESFYNISYTIKRKL